MSLISTVDRVERIRILLEIRFNQLIFGLKPSYAMTYDEFWVQTCDSGLHQLLTKRGEAEEALLWVRSNFAKVTEKKPNLPFPTHYNADSSLSMLSYAITRCLKPDVVLETGVGYGITSAVILRAMEHNDSGELISIDLPPLSDPYGTHTGLAVPEYLRRRWALYFGSSRQLLPKTLRATGGIGLFISDSANVYTLQRYEFESTWGVLSPGGMMVFNNIGRKLQRFLKSVDKSDFYSVWQMEKPSCVTGLLLKK